MRIPLAVAALAALSACATSVPDSGAGVGFGSVEEFRAQQAAREAALRGDTGSSVTVVPPPGEDQTAQAIDPASTGSSGASGAVGTDETAPTTASLGQARSGEISDEQNFDAVSGRETIESDAARIAAQREQFRVIEPTALPTRSGSGANIVAYALTTRNQVGQSIYSRSVFSTENRALRNCSEYASADQAQQAFLEGGGPERDRRGLDPDGDGFACAWDPAPFRAVAN